MARGTVLPVESVINGSFGELYDEENEFIANCQEVSFKVINIRKEWRSIGTARTSFKAAGTTGEGQIKLLKVNSKFLAKISAIMWNDTEPFSVGRLLIQLDDPESIGVEQVILVGVKLWEVNGGFKVNDILEEIIPFTFQSISLPLAIPWDENSMMQNSSEETYLTKQRNL